MNKKILLMLLICLVGYSLTAMPLLVTKTMPANGAIINAEDFENIEVLFDQAIDPKTLNIFTVLFQNEAGDKIFGKIDYDNILHKLIFTPQESLEEGKTYRLTLKKGISSLNGNTLPDDYIISFKTASTAKKNIPSNLLLSHVYPLPNSDNIPPTAKISIQFQKDVDPASINLYTFRIVDETGNIYGDIEYNSLNKTATFTPIPQLDPKTKYTVHLDKNITFSDGTTLGNDMEWSFYTQKSDEISNDTLDTQSDSPSSPTKTHLSPSFTTTISKNYSSKSSSNNLLIHKGDLLNIIVYNKKGIKELGQKTRVYLDGTLTFPYAGTIQVEGKTILELKKELEKRLSNFYMNPTVNVWFEKKSSKLEQIKITIIGAVSLKGSVKIDRNTTLIDVLASHNPLPIADLSKVEIKRNGNVITVDCSYITGAANKDIFPHIPLQDGDIIFVPVKQTKNFYFYISGYVKNPGRYEYEPNMTLIDGIYKAGGFSEWKDNNYGYGSGYVSAITTDRRSVAQRGQYYYKIKIYRKDKNGQKKTITISTKEIYDKMNYDKDILIQPGDYINVEEKILKKEDYVYLFGDVEVQGRYDYTEGMSIMDLLSYSGGVTRESKWANVIRKDSVTGKDKVIFIDLRNLFHRGKLKEDITLKPADIVFVSKVRYKNVFWKLGDYLNRSLFPSIGQIVTLDELLYKLKNLKVLK